MIFVDEPILVYRGRPGWCHMFSDARDDGGADLHGFARRLGLKEYWFQNPKPHDHPHYDLAPSYRAKALAFGAREMSGKLWIATIVRPRRFMLQGYHKAPGVAGDYQAIIPPNAVKCAACLKPSMYVWGYVSGDLPMIQLCGDCAHKVDGRVYFVGQKVE